MQPDDDKTRTHSTLTSGTMVSHYRIIEKIGAGGMGEVYLAEDTQLNRKVALKFLPPHLCQDADCRARFKREAQAAAKLDHPNIISVFEVGEWQGRPFFSMQHVEGQSLKEVIAGKTLALDRIIEIGIQVCEGLQAAHEKGITHRDIKPSNILIDSHGRARIVDFGLASVAGSNHLTKTGSTLGTIGYMSPEQVRGEQVDHRTDLFSFGVVLYEMITGHAPFKADSEAATLHAITNSKPEILARFRREVPVELQSIIDKALEKNVSTRYQHSDDLAADLKRLTAATVRTQAPRRDLWNRYVVTTAVAVLLIIAGYWAVNRFLLTESQMPESARKMLAVLPFENLGSPEDEYFADGITDEITGKLATIGELGVISRTSTMQYKKTTKNLKQIAEELGVDYVLEGTIRWDKRGDTGRVRIVPQLIRVADDTHLWSDTYQRSLTDIFAMQAEIATRILEVMNITVRESKRSTLQTPPTRSEEAYQMYLHAEEPRPDLSLSAAWELQIEKLTRAVEIDPSFALAYSKLSLVHSGMYLYGIDVSTNRLALSKQTVDRAFALQPALPEVHLAYCYYYYRGLRDYDNALRELAVAEIGLPNDAGIQRAKGYILRRRGEYKAALESLKRALKLDPRDAGCAFQVALTCQYMRDFASALEYSDKSIALEPDQIDAYWVRAWTYLCWRADTAMARTSLAAIPRQNINDTRLAWFDLYILKRDYVTALDWLASVDSAVNRTQVLIETNAQRAGLACALKGDLDRARTYFDSARIILERELNERPEDHRVHSALGQVYAGLGRREDAIREGRLGVELCPVSKDMVSGLSKVWSLAEIYVLVGDYDLALDKIEYLLTTPSSFSVPYLQLHPLYDPMRNLPRYQKLLEKYGT
jgi:serine/threonine protein kinase/tetratricopeptide (TPR) repeat protein